MKHRALFTALALLAAPALASAHVGYVIGESDLQARAGRDFGFLFSTLFDPKNLGIAAMILIVIGALFPLFKKISPIANEVKRLDSRLTTYHTLIPWIIRLSLGIALIGAGSNNSLISPILSGFHQYANFQTLIGFLILAGFLLVLSIPAAVALFTIAFLKTPYLIGNLDFLALALAFVILANSRPGVDHLLGLKFPRGARKHKRWLPLILRTGLGLVFIYLALHEKILNPHLSELVAIKYNLVSIIPVSPAIWTLSAGLTELATGFMLLIGFRTRLVSVIAFAVITFSFFYFKEDVTSHVTLFGALSILFITGGGSHSMDEKMTALAQNKTRTTQ